MINIQWTKFEQKSIDSFISGGITLNVLYSTGICMTFKWLRVNINKTNHEQGVSSPMSLVRETTEQGFGWPWLVLQTRQQGANLEKLCAADISCHSI